MKTVLTILTLVILGVSNTFGQTIVAEGIFLEIGKKPTALI
ncbi:MAG: hypothetical protein R2764_17565 [Bacteroidales bacterium]